MSVWLFPGQGTQTVGMGLALSQASKAAKAVFDRADEALGESLSKLIFEGPAESLTSTSNAQPAILTASIAALAALKEAWPELPPPRFAAGHSLGEYSALVAAGALKFEDAVATVRKRGEAMQSAVPVGVGAMAAVMGGSPADVEGLCAAALERCDPGSVLSPANFNAAGQVVIAGHAAAIDAARALAPDRALKALPLKVSAPFHCSLMAPAARVVDEALRRIEIGDLAFPVISNVEALANTDASRVRGLLVSQVDGPVRWHETMQRLAAEGCTKALEIGPGKVLAGLAKRSKPPIRVLSVFDAERLTEAKTFWSDNA